MDNKLREVVERVVAQALDAHVSALKSEIVESTSRELQPLLGSAETSGEAFGDAHTSAAGAATDLLNAAFSTILDSQSQAEILSSLLEGAGTFSQRSALFVIKGGKAVGWRGRGFDNNDAIKSISFDPTSGLAGRAYADRQPVQAAAAEFDPGFIAAVGEPLSGTNAIVLPLVLRDKVAALVYADGGVTGKIDPAALACLTRGAGLWLEVVAARKAGTSVASAEAEPERTDTEKIAAMAEAVTASAPAPSPEPSRPFATAAAVAAAGEISASDEEVHKKAKRFAKLLVDEIKLYNQQKVADGRASHDLYSRLKDDIDKSRASYEKRYGQTAAGPADYFTEELVRILCDGDAALLGSSFSR